MIRRMKNFFDQESDKKTLTDNAAPKKGINIVLYPREYMIDGNPENHYVSGVTLDGRVIKVRLRLDPKYLESIEGKEEKVPPRLSEFARKDYKAPRPCIASPDNGRDKREGVLLFSKAYPVDEDETEYVAGWAVLLAEHDGSPDPLFGLGRIQIDAFEYGECQRIKDDIERLESLVATPHHDATADAKLSRLYRELHNATTFRFRAFMFKPYEIERIYPLTEQKMRDIIIHYLDKYTCNGMYGGVFVRVIDKKTGLVTRMSEFVEITFNQGRIVTPDEVYNEFMYGKKNESGRVIKGGGGIQILRKSDDIEVDIIPTQSVNCGPLGNKYYKDYDQYNSLINTYTDSTTGLPMLCDVAIRTWVNPQTGNTLLARIYAISPMKGNEFEMDEKGRFTHRLEGKSYTGAIDSDLIERATERAEISSKRSSSNIQSIDENNAACQPVFSEGGMRHEECRGSESIDSFVRVDTSVKSNPAVQSGNSVCGQDHEYKPSVSDIPSQFDLGGDDGDDDEFDFDAFSSPNGHESEKTGKASDETISARDSEVSVARNNDDGGKVVANPASKEVESIRVDSVAGSHGLVDAVQRGEGGSFAHKEHIKETVIPAKNVADAGASIDKSDENKKPSGGMAAFMRNRGKK